METLKEALALLGPIWAVAVGAEFVAVAMETWGSVKTKGAAEAVRRKGALALVMGLVALVTPILLIVHGYTIGYMNNSRELAIAAAGIAGAAIVLGMIAGSVFGLMLRVVAPLVQIASMPLSVIALVLAILSIAPHMPGEAEWALKAFKATTGL